ncbi:MAG: hypothetical protein IT581_21460 [Verrucomicrobiales bacterium]|nr:hypothetical protein [Verrucomicrobiales bacterium]
MVNPQRDVVVRDWSQSRWRANRWLCALGLAMMLSGPGADGAVLWQIGESDNGGGEFALAPQGYQRFKEDGFFVVGRSDPRVDWPYVQPGPADGWAGSRRHTFAILFGLKSPPSAGECRLIVDLVDTQGSAPPLLRLEINGHRVESQLPPGAGDASIYGEPGKGREHVWTVPFDVGWLRTGNNQVELTSWTGSWMLYDSLRLETPEGVQLAEETPGTTLVRTEVPPVWLKDGDTAYQPVTVTLRHVGPGGSATVRLGNADPVAWNLKPGLQTLTLRALARSESETVRLVVSAQGVEVAAGPVSLAPPKMREIWVLPHSHVDVGYTHQQSEIVRIQIENLEKAMRLSAASARNPPGEQFRWNPEAIWSLDHYLRQATDAQRDALVGAVRRGEVGVDALYGNMLTGLCRPEELAQCLSFAPRWAKLTGVPVESAAICDVPGWTWGMVSVMAQAGVKYFAIGPNQSARIGTIHQWDNRPFYWKSQSGRERVLCWVVDNYHHLGDLESHVLSHAESLAAPAFAFDTSFIYWVGSWPDGGVDNAPPDAKLVEKVVAWNAKYARPRVRISTAGEFFRDFEKRFGSKVPEFSGDLTPYWEDGAGSTARETGMNRESAERLVQAEALFALGNRQQRPAARFEDAWKNVLLYSEHTWGAHNSVSNPDLPFVLNQWRVKQGFALDADRQSRELLESAVQARASTGAAGEPGVIDVLNTTAWARTDLALVPLGLLKPETRGIVDGRGRRVPVQRLASGELAFVARDVPAFGSSRYTLVSQETSLPKGLRVEGSRMRSSLLSLEIDPGTGAVRSLRRSDSTAEWVDPSAPVALNDYRYVLGTNAAGAMANGPVNVTVLDSGPLVATLRVESDAPGCRRLIRQVRLVEGLDRVELVNEVDRLPIREKDSVHFGYGFHVPGGQIRMETPWGVVRPNHDQLPGACRNWFTVQRWVDVSNDDLGITWAPIDAPLMEVGGITANLMGSVGQEEWLTNAVASTTLYSWAQNNHWFTNYKADQPGVTKFRYGLRPHRGGYSAAASARFGVELSRPLLVVPARGGADAGGGVGVTLSRDDVLLETLKASEDGKALILRLFGVSGVDREVRLKWRGLRPVAVALTDLSERPGAPLGSRIHVPAFGMVCVRAELVQ